MASMYMWKARPIWRRLSRPCSASVSASAARAGAGGGGQVSVLEQAPATRPELDLEACLLDVGEADRDLLALRRALSGLDMSKVLGLILNDAGDSGRDVA